MKQNIMQYVMVAMLIAGAYFLGVYKTKADLLANGTGQVAQVAGQETAQPTPPPLDKAKVDALFADEKNLIFGNKDAKIKFVEFSDTSCPYCHIAAGKNPELNKEVGSRFQLSTDGGSYVAPVIEMKKLVDSGKAAFAWFYTPGHGNGEMGTRALYCADEKGKFWEVHDLLMSNKGYDINNETVQNDKGKSGLMADFLAPAIDASFMKSCLESDKYDSRINSDPQIASEFGYGATPTFFINDKVVEGASSWNDGFKAIVDPLL
jgi:protein-disulfide isomerase